MKRFLQKRKRKGFTLVELLIVIIIIGILAGSMLLVMGAGKDKAEATKIISNLRSLKAAGLMYYADHDAWPTGSSATGLQASLDSYMDATVTDHYKGLAKVAESHDQWIGLDLSSSGANVDTRVKTKLDDYRKSNSGVIYGGDASTPGSGDVIGDYVWMPIN